MLAPGVFSPWSTEPPNPSRLNVFAISDTSGIAVRRFGGFVAKYLGDGVLVYFGHPEAMRMTPVVVMEMAFDASP